MQISIKVFVFGLLLCVSTLCFGQIRPDFISSDQDEVYETENVFGLAKATNSGLISALFYRHSNLLSENNLAQYGIELANTRHPREARITSTTGSSFVPGKSNMLISIRPFYGREKIFFKKAPQQGVRVSGMISGGPTIGLEDPYYVNFQGGRSEQYDPAKHNPYNIIGSAGPFKGLFESKIVPGLHFKASLTFETNSTKSRVFGIQTGFTVEVFTRKINIIPEAENKSTFTAAFIALYFGKRR